MRKATMLLAVVALMVALMTGAAAAKQNGKNRATYNFKGTLEEVAADGSYLVVDVTDGNKRGRAHLGVQQFRITSDTDFEVNEEDASLSELVVGEDVKVQSKAAKDATQFDARNVTMELEDDSDEEVTS